LVRSSGCGGGGVVFEMCELNLWLRVVSYDSYLLLPEMSFSDGYWFSYISSTTIGLGDIFLEPEVILTEDLVTFPLLFLVSFVFLSSFFSKLAEMYGSFHAIDILLARIKMLDAPGDGEHAPEGGDDAPEGSKDTSEGGHDASEGGHDASEGGHDASEGGHDASEGSYEHG
jgi:hypothetical protein